MGGSPGELSVTQEMRKKGWTMNCDVTEAPVTQEKRKNGWRMSCDVGEATEGLENQL